MRSLWNGSLSFGLVTIPVKLYSATEDHDVAFHQVHAADGGRIRYQRVCEVCGNIIQYQDIAKAYSDEDGQAVILTDEDFAALPADRSREIAVAEFVPAEQIDPLLFDRAYYLEPPAAAAKAYVLLRRTLQSTDRVAVVRFALRQRTQLAVLRVHGDLLAVQTLRWPDEIRAFDVPEQVSTAKVTDREMQMATTLVDTYATDFDPGEFTDEYQVQLRELIDAKLAGGEAYEPEAPAAEGEDAEVLDLLAALERSVARRRDDDGEEDSGTARRRSRAKATAAGAGKEARSGSRKETSRGGDGSGDGRRDTATGTKSRTKTGTRTRSKAGTKSGTGAGTSTGTKTGTGAGTKTSTNTGTQTSTKSGTTDGAKRTAVRKGA